MEWCHLRKKQQAARQCKHHKADGNLDEQGIGQVVDGRLQLIAVYHTDCQRVGKRWTIGGQYYLPLLIYNLGTLAGQNIPDGLKTEIITGELSDLCRIAVSNIF